MPLVQDPLGHAVGEPWLQVGRGAQIARGLRRSPRRDRGAWKGGPDGAHPTTHPLTSISDTAVKSRSAVVVATICMITSVVSTPIGATWNCRSSANSKERTAPSEKPKFAALTRRFGGNGWA